MHLPVAVFDAPRGINDVREQSLVWSNVKRQVSSMMKSSIKLSAAAQFTSKQRETG